MAKNEGLSKAKKAKQDEFYTQYEDIQSEMNHYEDKFKGKTVLCNCDDPFESNFCKFFLRNFNYLGLKRLICTSYGTSPVVGEQLTLFDYMGEPVRRGNGYVLDVSKVPMQNGRGVSDADIDALLHSKRVRKLKGDGDFRSEECIEYLKQADIVVTNPPFSLFREYVAQLIEYDKKFIIIGNQNAVTYKEIFPLIQKDKMWIGYHCGDMAFTVPEYYEERSTRYWIDETGQKWRSMGNVCWYTNIDIVKRHEPLILYKRYYGNEEEYPKYDNYDAINVDKVADIPCDYFPSSHSCSQIINVERERDGIISPLSSRNATESWASPSPSSTSTTRSSLKSSEQPKAKVKDSHSDCGTPAAEFRSPSYAENVNTSDCLFEENCNGIMGVPITFLDKYNPEQFEIIGLAAGNIKGLAGIPSKTGKDGPYLNGKLRYGRILIKRRQHNEN